MAKPIPDPEAGQSFLMSLLLGEILTRRGEPGPLARPWATARSKPMPQREKPKRDDNSRKGS